MIDDLDRKIVRVLNQNARKSFRDVAKDVDWSLWDDAGITDKELNCLAYPEKSDIEDANLEPIYLSYFVPWDGYRNYQIAKQYGFRDITHEWIREGYIENFDQVDTIGYLVNAWLKYPKLGFHRATDVSCYWIRSGKITREQGINYVKEHDHKLDQKILDDWLDFTGYTDKEFWVIVEKFWNRDIFEKVDGIWKLKNPIWKREFPDSELKTLVST